MELEASALPAHRTADRLDHAKLDELLHFSRARSGRYARR